MHNCVVQCYARCCAADAQRHPVGDATHMPLQLMLMMSIDQKGDVKTVHASPASSVDKLWLPGYAIQRSCL